MTNLPYKAWFNAFQIAVLSEDIPQIKVAVETMPDMSNSDFYNIPLEDKYELRSYLQKAQLLLELANQNISKEMQKINTQRAFNRSLRDYRQKHFIESYL